jgi:hypothetical protein
MVDFYKDGGEPVSSINTGNFLTSWANINFPRKKLYHAVSMKSIKTCLGHNFSPLNNQ